MRDSVFRGEIASLIYGAVQHVIVPDIQVLNCRCCHAFPPILWVW